MDSYVYFEKADRDSFRKAHTPAKKADIAVGVYRRHFMHEDANGDTGHIAVRVTIAIMKRLGRRPAVTLKAIEGLFSEEADRQQRKNCRRG